MLRPPRSRRSAGIQPSILRLRYHREFGQPTRRSSGKKLAGCASGRKCTHNLSPSQVCTSEALQEAGTRCFCLLKLGSVFDICQCFLDLQLFAFDVLSQASKCVSCLVNVAPSDSIPWRFGCKIGTKHEWKRPHPLQSKRKFPSKITLHIDHGSDNTRREQDSCTPTHADVCSHIGSQDRRYNFASVSSGQRLYLVRSRA